LASSARLGPSASGPLSPPELWHRPSRNRATRTVARVSRPLVRQLVRMRSLQVSLSRSLSRCAVSFATQRKLCNETRVCACELLRSGFLQRSKSVQHNCNPKPLPWRGFVRPTCPAVSAAELAEVMALAPQYDVGDCSVLRD
jgi:hypothetical protein